MQDCRYWSPRPVGQGNAMSRTIARGYMVDNTIELEWLDKKGKTVQWVGIDTDEGVWGIASYLATQGYTEPIILDKVTPKVTVFSVKVAT